MQKQFYLFFLLVLLGLSNGTATSAQKPVKTTPPARTNNKKPAVNSTLGTATGTINLPADVAKQLLGLRLKVADDKNVEYVISSYQFAYKRMGITEDEATGKTSPQSDIAANRFTTTPLPDVWQKNIIEGLHKGEELYFFDIIVFDKQGRRFFAPELKIIIQ